MPTLDGTADASSAGIVGHLVEAGDLDALDGEPGLLIRTTREQLKGHGRNLVFRDVLITLKIDSGAEHDDA